MDKIPLDTVVITLPGGTASFRFHKNPKAEISISLKGKPPKKDRLLGKNISLKNCKMLIDLFCIPH